MAREKKKPDFDNIKMGINPFTLGLSIAITKKKKLLSEKNGEKIYDDVDIEVTPYTKVFMVEAARFQVDILPIRSKELYLHLIHVVEPATDYVWIDKVKYMKDMRIKALNTYKAAIAGLVDNAYIQVCTKAKDTYWINPHFFFKGSRINKYPHNLVERIKIDKQ